MDPHRCIFIGDDDGNDLSRAFSDLLKSEPAHASAQPPQGYPRIGRGSGLVPFDRKMLF